MQADAKSPALDAEVPPPPAPVAAPAELQLTITTPLGVSITADPTGLLVMRHAPEAPAQLQMTHTHVHGAPLRDADCSAAAQDLQEAWRAVLPDSCVVTCSRAGTLRVLLPDASVQLRATNSLLSDADGASIAAWVATAMDGTRVELPDSVPKAEPPSTKEGADAADTDAPAQVRTCSPCLLQFLHCLLGALCHSEHPYVYHSFA